MASVPCRALDNGVGRTPAMGWNSWNRFHCKINEHLIKKQADALVSSGLSKLGYVYLNVDDCWQSSRNESGFIKEDPTAFPSGMRALSDYVHSKGLKFGLYSSAGLQTCEGRPGGLHHEIQDAQTYASWKIDYFKYDNCHNEGRGNKSATIERYGALRDALNSTGRPINYALCSWGEVNIWEFGGSLGNSWRTTLDIQDSWNSIMSIIKQNQNLSTFAMPGGFNDMDMLEVGNGHMTTNEYRSHYTIWAALKSPLLLGHDLTRQSSTTLSIISNPEVIAINQDPLGKSAVLRVKYKNVWVWVGELIHGERVLVVFNAGYKDVDVVVGLSVFAVTKEDFKETEVMVVKARDLWTHKDWEEDFKGEINVGRIPYHGVRLLRLSCKNGKFGSLKGVEGSLESDEEVPIKVREFFTLRGYVSSYHRVALVVPPFLASLAFVFGVWMSLRRGFTISSH
ncbi:UNVERIFIED_CONTAM: hypothetical protein HDU68_005499, partial [Siphonaria sp. JEL0065]